MESLRHVRRLVTQNEYVLRHASIMMLLLAKAFLLFFSTFNLIISFLVKQEDDAHISEILKAKFTKFQNFHTLMYTCAREFDFMEMEAIKNTSLTLLFPVGVFVAVIILCQVLVFLFSNLLRDMTYLGPEEKIPDEGGKDDAADTPLADSISTTAGKSNKKNKTSNSSSSSSSSPPVATSAPNSQVFVSTATAPPPVPPPP